jgi:hypothetical protein
MLQVIASIRTFSGINEGSDFGYLGTDMFMYADISILEVLCKPVVFKAFSIGMPNLLSFNPVEIYGYFVNIRIDLRLLSHIGWRNLLIALSSSDDLH